MVGDRDAEVGDRHQDGQAELAHQQTYQARLKKHGNAMHINATNSKRDGISYLKDVG